ncbi:hypothetical protein [Bradyrhizobium sp. 62]|uniref:hypothetical protein n=1 Tax=Bradyrhizobium sp. 62 TaxID=1043588 RepID=UPI001FFBAF02|nr:hypothetical protein [Bradyrhizobium sp. 62]MCK1368313.1 hypothetical protein [Bradyrhizobium sp. 62]
MSFFKAPAAHSPFRRGAIVRSRSDGGAMVIHGGNEEGEITCWFFHFERLQIRNFYPEDIEIEVVEPLRLPVLSWNSAVYLRSGGPKMTIAELKRDTAVCTYLSSGRDEFPVLMLLAAH